jgi:hypothetical protein
MTTRTILALVALAVVGACGTVVRSPHEPSGASSLTGGGGGSSSACANAAQDCPAPVNECLVPVCIGETCDVDTANLGAPCAAGVCDGAGLCIECIFDEDCGENETCLSNVCETYAKCDEQPTCGSFVWPGCSACALFDQCSAQVIACMNTTDCTGVLNCASGCADTDVACRQQCEAESPEDLADFHELIRCVYCDVCPKSCAGNASICD